MCTAGSNASRSDELITVPGIVHEIGAVGGTHRSVSLPRAEHVERSCLGRADDVHTKTKPGRVVVRLVPPDDAGAILPVERSVLRDGRTARQRERERENNGRDACSERHVRKGSKPDAMSATSSCPLEPTRWACRHRQKVVPPDNSWWPRISQASLKLGANCSRRLVLVPSVDRFYPSPS